MSTSSAFLFPFAFVGVSKTDNSPGSLDVLRGFIAECLGLAFALLGVRCGVDGPASEVVELIGVEGLRMLRRGVRVLVDVRGRVWVALARCAGLLFALERASPS